MGSIPIRPMQSMRHNAREPTGLLCRLAAVPWCRERPRASVKQTQIMKEAFLEEQYDSYTCVSDVTSNCRIFVLPELSSFSRSASAQPVRFVKPAKTVNPSSSMRRAKHQASGDSQPVIKIALPAAETWIQWLCYILMYKDRGATRHTFKWWKNNIDPPVDKANHANNVKVDTCEIFNTFRTPDMTIAATWQHRIGNNKRSKTSHGRTVFGFCGTVDERRSEPLRNEPRRNEARRMSLFWKEKGWMSDVG